MKSFRFSIGASLLFFSFLFLGLPVSPVGAADGSDAIAVRIIPNLNHYSISRWYESQGFQGSPQAVSVDGYEGIRDGRSVYVNAANVDPATGRIYTNIYLISYTQDPAPNTVDILGQIISHWKFNDNLSETASCTISALNCTAVSDCPNGSFCRAAGAADAGTCVLKDAKKCLVDADCPANFFCDSLKSKVTRDVKRIGRLAEIEEALANFKISNNRYPRLDAGSYLAGRSVSVWPSWQQELLADLAMPASFIDPINRLGACPGHDAKTCWNAESKKFNNQGLSAAGLPVLPAGSYVFSYAAGIEGSRYDLCSVLESRTAPLNYHFEPNDPADSACAVSGVAAGGMAANTMPRIIGSSLSGTANAEFIGYVRATDQENDPLTWVIGAPLAGWVGGPVLRDTGDKNQKQIYAQKAGPAGTYQIYLSVEDNHGQAAVEYLPVTISSSSISIEAENAEYIADPVSPLSYSFFYSGRGLQPSSYTLNKVSGPSGLDLFKEPMISGLSKTITAAGTNRFQVDYSGIISTSTKFYSDLKFSYKIDVKDEAGKAATKNFSITVKPDAPQLDFSCAPAARIQTPGMSLSAQYSCFIGPAQQGNHTLSYSASGLPGGISLLGQNLTGIPFSAGTSNITIKATNEYGASSTKSFVLRADNYCGDGTKQLPNTEGRGGIFNDGFEDCDGTDGVAPDVQSSNSGRQYGCATTASSARPYPITSSDQCVFLSPARGGGYCGDGYCQKLSGSIDETIACPKDCKPRNPADCVPSCTGKSCGPDGCGGTCGTCSPAETCTSSGNCVSSKCEKDADCNDLNACTSRDISTTTDACDPVTKTCINNLNTSISQPCTHYYGTTTEATGLCIVDGKSYCSNMGLTGQPVYTYGDCNYPLKDPRSSVCSTKCAGETFRISDTCSGTCDYPGNGSACMVNLGHGEYERRDEIQCQDLEGFKSFSGYAPCNSACTGYDNSGCLPIMCSTGSSKDCWYQVPASEDYRLHKDGLCMIRMYVDKNNILICSHNTVSAADIAAGADAANKWNWFTGKLKEGENHICTNPDGSTQTVKDWLCIPEYKDITGANKKCDNISGADPNPTKCRWQSVQQCNQLWTNYCFINKTW